MAKTKLRIRSQQVVDCPRARRIVPLHTLAAGSHQDQLKCRRCDYYGGETCSNVTCTYGQKA